MDLPPHQAPPGGDAPEPVPRPSVFGERASEKLLRAAFVLAFLWICRDLAIPVLLGGIAAVVFYPLHAWIRGRSRRWARVSPAIVTIGALLVILGPMTGLAYRAVITANELLSGTSLGDIVAFGERLLRSVGRSVGADVTELEMLRGSATQAAARASEWVGGVLAAFVGALPLYVTYVFLLTLAFYYGLRDGERFVNWLRRISPAGPSATDELVRAMRTSIRGAVLGMFIVAFVQGGICMVALLALRVPGAVLWGLFAALASVLPVVGTTPVTMGATIYLLVMDRPVASGIMFATAIFIGIIDNVIRPYFQGSHDRVHPFVELLAIFGGIVVLGISGLFIGPVLAAMALWGINTWRGRREIDIVGA
jgi:predicted PurR-regulated permease PerM